MSLEASFWWQKRGKKKRRFNSKGFYFSSFVLKCGQTEHMTGHSGGNKLGQESSLKRQVKKQLLEYMQSMDFRKSNRLPSEEKLSIMLGVSRVTLRSVLKELEMEGKVFSRHGSGTYVNPMAQKVVFNLAVPELYENIIRKGGAEPDIRLEGIFIEKAGEEAVSSLNAVPGEEVVVVKKTFFAGNAFALYCIDYFLREQLSREQIQSFSKTEFSSFDYLFQYKGRKAVWDTLRIQTVTNSQFPEINGPAGLSGEECRSFLLLKGINYDKTDTPFIYSHTYVDTEVIEYNMIRRKDYRYEPFY